MIKGAVRLDGKYSDQTRMAAEEEMRILVDEWKRLGRIPKDSRPPWLQSCGPATAAMGAWGAGYEVDIPLPGGAILPGEDAANWYFNDPDNDAEMQAAVRWHFYDDKGQRKQEMPDNRQPALYPLMAQRVWGAKCAVKWNVPRDHVRYMLSQLERNRPLQVCLPGHYVLIDRWNTAIEEFGGKDPWRGRRPGAGPGMWYTDAEINSIGREYMIIWLPRGDDGSGV